MILDRFCQPLPYPRVEIARIRMLMSRVDLDKGIRLLAGFRYRVFIDERLIAGVREYLYVVALQSLYDALGVLKPQLLPEFFRPRHAESYKVVEHVAFRHIVVAGIHEVEQFEFIR